MSQLFINVIGHNASGKTHIAKQLEAKLKLSRVSGDDFRMFVYEHIEYFKKTSLSYPSHKYSELNPLAMHYRFEMSWTLLRAGQSLTYDGSGLTRDYRNKYLSVVRKDFPQVKTVIIRVDIDEKELLKRLAKRDKEEGARWTDLYHDYRKNAFEEPQADEADVILRYDQTNYDKIEQKIGELLK